MSSRIGAFEVVSDRRPFPLQWPVNWPRTSGIRHGRGTLRWQAKFDSNFARDRDAVVRQLRKRGSHIVITSDLPTRADGLPYASANASDPGIAVYWVERGAERVIACDRWKSCALNLRAIDMLLEALRGIDRWGASEMVERAFAGFAALPPGRGEEYVAPPAPRAKNWREVLGVDRASLGTELQLLDRDEQLAIIKMRHRRLIKEAHPDAGGSHELAAEINAALAQAEAELEGTFS